MTTLMRMAASMLSARKAFVRVNPSIFYGGALAASLLTTNCISHDTQLMSPSPTLTNTQKCQPTLDSAPCSCAWQAKHATHFSACELMSMATSIVTMTATNTRPRPAVLNTHAAPTRPAHKHRNNPREARPLPHMPALTTGP